MFKYVFDKLVDWVTYEEPLDSFSSKCDFERLRYEVRPGDVLLMEGRSRVSDVIKTATQSAWSHACLYVGRIHDIDDAALRTKLQESCGAQPDEQLIIESLMGHGTIAAPLAKYKFEHLRICRPRGLSREDAQTVLRKAIESLGTQYDVRQIFDLLRYFLPWSIFPRQWRSTLFNTGAGANTKMVCSTMIANAFHTVHFPIVPIVKRTGTDISFQKQSPRLITPKDFDYSPYFEIIKYPITADVSLGMYKDLPWNDLKTADAGQTDQETTQK